LGNLNAGNYSEARKIVCITSAASEHNRHEFAGPIPMQRRKEIALVIKAARPKARRDVGERESNRRSVSQRA
jgi:hypothetical protein